MSYDKKMGNMMGALFYDYARFIKDNTPERSTILIPPQGFPWPQTGNIGYLRYLLYPRTLINGGEKESKVDIKDVDYVLVDYGESSISEYGFTNVWPKFDVSGDYIIYWDPKTGETIKDNAGIYKYKVNDKSERWGIIKIIK